MNRLFLTLIFFCASLFAFVACKPKEVGDLNDSASALKTVFAAETAKLAGANKKIVLIVSKPIPGATGNVGQDFKDAFQKVGVSVVETKVVDLGDPMRYGTYGLSAADFLDAIEKHPEAGAIASLVGAPRISSPGQVPATHPPVSVIATRQIGLAPGVAGNPDVLAQLLRAKIIQLAIVDGTGASGQKGDKARALFDQHYQILRANE